jgi:hypothetical protein
LSYLLPAIGGHLHFSLIRTSGSVRSGLVVFPDPKNDDLAVGISLLSCIEAEIYVVSYLLPVLAAIFDFSLIRTSDSVRSSLIVLSDPKKAGIVAGVSSLSCIKAENTLC